MPAASSSGPANPIAVMSPQFCAPYPVDLTVTKKAISLTDGVLGVTDVNGNILFRVKGTIFSIRDHRVLLDVSSNSLVSMQQKIVPMHRRWEVFRGDSSHSKDLFSVRKFSLLQFRRELDVFLASNTGEHHCDFKRTETRHLAYKGIWHRGACRWVCEVRDPTFVRNHFDRAATISEHGHRRPVVIALLRRLGEHRKDLEKKQRLAFKVTSR